MTSGGNKGISWVVIILLIIFFWPVGLILLFQKLKTDRTATLKSGKLIGVVSYILMGMGAIYLLMTLSEDGGMLIPAILFGGGGIWIFIISRRMKKNAEKYRKYISIVINQGQSSIDEIAYAMGVSYEIAMQDLQKMIDAGYFSNAYINSGRREIVLARQVLVNQTVVSPAQNRKKVVVCSGCGANNTVIEGQVGECEYCGNYTQG